MISGSKGFKICFQKQPPFRGTFFFCWCDIFSFFEFILLGNSSMAPVLSFNQINKLPENLYLTIGTVSAISPSLQRPCCFNNIILYHNEAIKNAVIIQNSSLSFRPSFSEPSLSERVSKPGKHLIDVHCKNSGFNREEKLF